jgi:HlyD family secretion protein
MQGSGATTRVRGLGRPARVPETDQLGEDRPTAAYGPMDRYVDSRPARLRRRLVFAAAALIAVTVVVVVYIRFGLTRAVVVSVDRLVISSVQSDVFDEYVPATARVAPRTTAYLDAIEGGQVAEVLVEEGALVHQGQPLVRLKNTNLQLEILGRQAQLMEQLDRLNATILAYEQTRLGHERDRIEATSQVEQLSQRLRRRQALQPSGAISAADVDEVAIDLGRYRKQAAAIEEAATIDEKFQREQVAQLRAAVKTIQENLGMAGETLKSLVVKAPITGQLTALDAHLGEAKSPGQRIGQIDQLDDYKVEADIDEFYLGRVAVGQTATTDIDGQEYPLMLAKVYSQVTDRQFKVDLLFAGDSARDSKQQSRDDSEQKAGRKSDAESDQARPESPGRPHEPSTSALRRGQSLQIRLHIGAAHRAVVIANGPFYDDTGGTWAFVLPPHGTEAQRHAIHLGRRNPQQIEVLSGLSAGDRIITSSYETLRGFDRIRIQGLTDRQGELP